MRWRAFATSALWNDCGTVHGLRGVYACACLRLFEWGDYSDAFVAMCVLGHASLKESLVYTTFRLDLPADVARLGRGALTEPRFTTP